MSRTASRSPLSIALLALAVLAGSRCSGDGATCEACDRHECRNLTFTIVWSDGSRQDTCCPRCGLHLIASERSSSVASLAVRDFDTAGVLEAGSAAYVEGSDVSPCAANLSSMPTDERGCCLKPVYDRCLPSLIAFGSRERAETFARDHGGIVKTFPELRSAAQERAPG